MRLTCAFCGEDFEGKRSAQKFCSARCNARNRAKMGTLAPNPRKLPPHAELLTLYESGMSCVDIAQRFNVHPSSVYGSLSRAGTTLRPAWVDAARKNTGRRGPDHWSFTGERKTQHGYVFIYRPDHPSSNKAGYVLEHRLVMERALGRFLDPSEHVHHIDGNPANNTADNLQVVSNSQHARLHDALGAYRKENPEQARIVARRAGRIGAAKRYGL